MRFGLRAGILAVGVTVGLAIGVGLPAAAADPAGSVATLAKSDAAATPTTVAGGTEGYPLPAPPSDSRAEADRKTEGTRDPMAPSTLALTVILNLVESAFSAFVFAVVMIYVQFWMFAQRTPGEWKDPLFVRVLRRVRLWPPAAKPPGLDDVRGIDEVKHEILDVIDFLKNPARYRQIGARVPKGIIFSGPPGVGKTMLARAIAHETGVPFFYASGAQFDEIFVGMGALRIRHLYKKARKYPAAIVFIDELDSLGQSRSFQMGPNGAGTHTLNQFLTELDGFTGSGIVTIGATNIIESLDSALTRPGRFDRLIHVPAPSLDGRKRILDLYLQRVRCDGTVNAEDIARSTIDMTGADLAQIVNEASLLAVRDKRKLVGQQDLLRAIERKALGIEYRKTITPAELRATAYHEAGHAIAAAAFTPDALVQKVSIIPTGRALGYTWHVARDEQHSMTREQALAEIRVAYGGFCAEELVLGTTSSGVRGDLETVGRLARQMVWQWGMGPVRYGVDRDTVSPGTRQELETAERQMTDACHDAVLALLTEKRALLDTVAAALLAKETLNGDDFKALIFGQGSSLPVGLT